jgi:hypothetical protein
VRLISPHGRGDHEILVDGDELAAYELFDEQLLTDGLPIVPPTPERVEATLAQTWRDPDEALGIVGDGRNVATVRNAAVNAVMAGCPPRLFPLALATAEILADPGFRIRDNGSTTSWEVLLVVSGPDLESLGFTTGTGVMRVGRRANSTLGRFTRLWIRNVADILPPPGYTDMAAIGQSVPVAMAEDEAATREIGWAPCREGWGGGPDDVLVAGQGIIAVSPPVYTAGATPSEHLDLLAEAIVGSSAHAAALGITSHAWTPVLAMNPAVAEVFARRGMCRGDVAQELAERATAPARSLLDGHHARVGESLDLPAMVAGGELDARYCLGDAPDRPLPVIHDPDALAVVVTGNPGRNQSRYFVPLGRNGRRGTRRAIWARHRPSAADPSP